MRVYLLLAIFLDGPYGGEKMPARAWHAITLQKNPIHIRGPSETNGWRSFATF